MLINTKPMHSLRLPREAVDIPFLEELKPRLDGALGSLICWGAALLRAGGGTGFKVPSNPYHSMTQ